LRAKCKQLAFAQQQIVADRPRNFQELGDFHIANGAFVFGHGTANAPEILRLLVSVFLVIVRRNEFILATREKFHEVAEKLSRLGQAPELVELQKRQIAAKQNPMSIWSIALRSGLTSCSSALQNAWNVLSVTALGALDPDSPRSRAAATTRCFISAAALSVNVRPRISAPVRSG